MLRIRLIVSVEITCQKKGLKSSPGGFKSSINWLLSKHYILGDYSHLFIFIGFMAAIASLEWVFPTSYLRGEGLEGAEVIPSCLAGIPDISLPVVELVWRGLVYASLSCDSKINGLCGLLVWE